jgi:hypothetical protein
MLLVLAFPATSLDAAGWSLRLDPLPCRNVELRLSIHCHYGEDWTRGTQNQEPGHSFSFMDDGDRQQPADQRLPGEEGS